MPQVLEQPQQASAGQDRQSTFARRLAISILRLTVVLMIAAAIGGGWYVARKGFGGRTRARIVEELHRRGVETSIGHLMLNPFRGLVARNVRIFGSRARGQSRHDSDLDLLVALEPHRTLLDIVGLKQDLEDRLHCRVDIVTEAANRHHGKLMCKS